MAFESRKLTAERRQRSRNKLSKVVSPHWLQRCTMLVKEPSRREIHVVCVPRFRSVVEHVPGVPWSAIRAVVHGIDVVDASNDARCQRRVIHDQLGHPIVEGSGLLRGR